MTAPVRLRIECHGAVQGVGFRPAVYRVARALDLTGWVYNGPDGVVIEVEGPEGAVNQFVPTLENALPPLARLDGIFTRSVEPAGSTRFEVISSEAGPRQRALVPPDATVCADCLADMDDPSDRRARYPFTTCTNCGPRFSIVRSLPYDRATTSMAPFTLCPECEGEYTNPADRRFHAEPVCCPACGPTLQLLAVDGVAIATGAEAIAEARSALAAGQIVAVQGLGGFQLACRADDTEVVQRLRNRKDRPSKPFAVMVADLPAAEQLVHLGTHDRAMLTSARGPIVLAPQRRSAAVAETVAPGIEDVGVLVATTPLHVELLRNAPFKSLVMTSGNSTDEPICRTPEEAHTRLAGIADTLLVHDREVVRRIDDSVVRSVPGGAVMVRRSRGWVPEPETLPVASPSPLVALGAHLQVTACVATGDQAFCSQHVGDLDTEPARQFLEEVVRGLEEFLAIIPDVIVVDHHPDYPSRWLGERLARERDGRLMEVQHHLAHAAAVLGEHGRFPAGADRALAVALDGTGLGSDGAPWGGEWLTLDGSLRWSRMASLEPVPLVGGELAVREPWRVAVAALVSAGGGELIGRTPLAEQVDPTTLDQVARLAHSPETWMAASGAGRLLEAAAALLGLCAVNRWEGEAAVRLESAAATAAGRVEPWTDVKIGHRVPGPALLTAAARRLIDGEDVARVAAGVHTTLADLVARHTARVASELGVREVAFGGGCLVNRLLRSQITQRLHAAGLTALLPWRVPPGDGGLAYGQAVLAAASLARDVTLEEVPSSFRVG